MSASIVKNIIKWIGIAVAAVVVFIIVIIASFYYRSGRIVGHKYESGNSLALYVPDDPGTVEYGRHLAIAVAGCTECHGANLAGAKLVDDPAFGRVYPPNITHGKGGLPADFDIVAFERVLRKGVRPDGTSLWIMPAYHYRYLSDEDVAALWAYVRGVPPVDQEWPDRKLGPVGNMLLAQSKLEMLVAPMVNSSDPCPPKPKADTTGAYGEYLARVSCIGCHRQNLSGGPIFSAPPDWPLAANITKGGAIANYTEADFFKTLRSGKRPSGDTLSSIMPWRSIGTMSDDELRALWNYLQGVPPAAFASNPWTEPK